MRTALLKRTEASDAGTFGSFIPDTRIDKDRMAWVSGELPWDDGMPSYSCVPAGVFEVVWEHSSKFGWCYHVKGVPGRSSILIHVGNFVGNCRLKGITADVLGCILLGKSKGELRNGLGKLQMAVRESAPAVLELQKLYAKQPFELTIVDATPSAAELVCRPGEFRVG